MSEKARELVERLRDEIGFDATVFEQLAGHEIDAAVAPLVKASTNLRTEIVRFFGTDDAPADGLNNAIRALNEALEGWKQ